MTIIWPTIRPQYTKKTNPNGWARQLACRPDVTYMTMEALFKVRVGLFRVMWTNSGPNNGHDLLIFMCSHRKHTKNKNKQTITLEIGPGTLLNR